MPISRQRQVALAARMVAVQDRYVARLRWGLRDFFRGQAQRAVYRLLHPTSTKTKALPNPDDLFDEVQDRYQLNLVLQPVLAEMIQDASQLASELTAGTPLVQASPVVQQYLTNRSATLVVGLQQRTLRHVRRMLAIGSERLYSPYQIAHGVPEDGYPGLRMIITEMYRGRAETIARTEIAYASQWAVHQQFQDMRVSEVDIIDGQGCGWTSHADPDKANGSRRTLIAAQQYPIAHPNCRRVSLPVLGR